MAVLLPVLGEDIFVVYIVSLEAALKRAISAIIAFVLVLLTLTESGGRSAINTHDVHIA